jgi:hypothetical protein
MECGALSSSSESGDYATAECGVAAIETDRGVTVAVTSEKAETVASRSIAALLD